MAILAPPSTKTTRTQMRVKNRFSMALELPLDPEGQSPTVSRHTSKKRTFIKSGKDKKRNTRVKILHFRSNIRL